MDTSRKRLADRQRPPRDGRDGKDGRDGSPGRKGEQGPPGERGIDGKDGRDLALVPAMATFDRDPDTLLTRRVDVADMDTAAPILSIIPIRGDDNLMLAAQIIPA